MKHSFFALLKAAILGRFNTNSDAPDKKQNSTTSPSTELKTINVQKDFEENGFTFFTENLILCSGDTSVNNAMTIGWGSTWLPPATLTSSWNATPASPSCTSPTPRSRSISARTAAATATKHLPSASMSPTPSMAHLITPRPTSSLSAKPLQLCTKPQPTSATTHPRNGMPISVLESIPSTSVKSSEPGNDNNPQTLTL